MQQWEHVRFRPDLAVEVLSPSTRQIDRGRKSDLLARHHVPEYWIADPERRRMVIYYLQDKQYVPIESDADGRFASRVFTGLRVDPSEFFSGLD